MDFSNIVSTVLSNSYYQYWIMAGATTGAIISGIHKLADICQESSPEYRYPMFERPIRCVYHTTRLAGHTGWGAAIGGTCAATAPVSIPLYCYWLYITDNSQKEKSS